MGTLNEDLSAIKEVEDKIVANKVARFAYTNEAYKTNDADGVDEYDVDNAQNIPIADASVLKVNETVLSKGYRAQASSITRMLVNHFFGRMSYNLNKVNDSVSNLIETLISHRGTANGFATLDENGRVPYSQLPESAMEYKGQWNAETNTPALADGTGTKGDFYIVSVSGTQNLGSGNVHYFENDRIIYDGSVWSRLSAGDVKAVNSVLPANGNVALTGEDIPVSPTDPTLLSAPLTTDRYADSSVTNAKIKDPISVAKGGTGATDAKNGFMSLANGLTQSQNPQDEEYMIYKSSGNWGLYTLGQFWNYIKNKISSVLGLTKDNYGGNSATATIAESANNMYSQIFDMSSLDKTKFYPLVCSVSYKFTEVAICSEDGPGTSEYNQNRIHFDISTHGWSDMQYTLNIREYTCYDNNEITIGCIGRGIHQGAWAIWLRGGIRYSCYSRDADLSLKTSDYTYFDETYTVGTNYYGGSNSTVEVIFTPQSTITSGSYSASDINANFIGNLTGNATTADKVKNALTINGQSFDGSSPVTLNISSGTDTKVYQNVSTNDNTYPILASDTANKTYSAPGEAIISNLLKMNPSTGNMTGWSNGSAYAICAVDPSGSEKIVELTGLTLTSGMTVTVLFIYGNRAVAPSLNVNYQGAKQIKVYLNGGKTTVTTQWDAGTSMTLMYDGTDFVVLGNPVVMSNFSGSGGYIKYANGLLIQWGHVVKRTPSDQTEAIMFPISYTQIPALNATWIVESRDSYSRLTIMSISQTQAVIRSTDHTTDGYTWMSIGW